MLAARGLAPNPPPPRPPPTPTTAARPPTTSTSRPTSPRPPPRPHRYRRSTPPSPPHHHTRALPPSPSRRSTRCASPTRCSPRPAGTRGADIFLAILAAAPDLWDRFTLIPSAHGTMGVRFLAPADREAAVRVQPFAARAGAAAVTLVRAWDTAVLDDYFIHSTPDHLVRSPDDLLAHVALRRYPAEQRAERDIAANCRGFGWVLEVDRACFDAPDLATVHVVLCVGHPREIPRELRIVYADGSASVVPVDVLGVWDWPAAFRAHGRYVRFFQQPQGGAAPALLGSRLQAISLS